MTFIDKYYRQIVATLLEIRVSALFTGSFWRLSSNAAMRFSKFSLKAHYIAAQDLCDQHLITDRELVT
jgi:hypothetical protein